MTKEAYEAEKTAKREAAAKNRVRRQARAKFNDPRTTPLERMAIARLFGFNRDTKDSDRSRPGTAHTTMNGRVYEVAGDGSWRRKQ